MSSPSLTKRNLRKNSSSSSTPSPASFTLLDIQKLIAESEERIKRHVNEKFDSLTEKISSLEASITDIKAVQVQQESDIQVLKNAVANQQCQIESFEEKERQCNLIVSNLKETDIEFNSYTISDDKDKILALFNHILPPEERVSNNDVVSTARLGRSGRNTRILKVRLSSVHCRNKILRSCKHLNLESVRRSFDKIYVNKDMSYLRRLEEKRLRERFKDLKGQYTDGSVSVRLRNGKLFLNQFVKDCVDYRNQLF